MINSQSIIRLSEDDNKVAIIGTIDAQRLHEATLYALLDVQEEVQGANRPFFDLLCDASWRDDICALLGDVHGRVSAMSLSSLMAPRVLTTLQSGEAVVGVHLMASRRRVVAVGNTGSIALLGEVNGKLRTSRYV
jgi:hypothetical protein